MSLQSYFENRWIRKHQTSPEEIANLLAICDRDIEQSRMEGLLPEWAFDIAYNAALQAATAALATAGYQAERANKHMRTIECLEYTVGLDKYRVTFLDKCRRKRNTAVYEQVGAISSREAKEMIRAATELRATVEEWIRATQPGLLSRRER